MKMAEPRAGVREKLGRSMSCRIGPKGPDWRSDGPPFPRAWTVSGAERRNFPARILREQAGEGQPGELSPDSLSQGGSP
jgi:hypothetical protein